MKKILYLPIETIVRELDSKLLLAHRALSRGYTVIIGQKSNVFKAANKLGFGIYFYKHNTFGNFPKQHDPGKPAFKYSALDEEGLVFLNDEAFIRRSKPNELKHLDIIFTWGSYQRNLLIENNPELDSKTIAVGNPRFDLLRPEFASTFKSEQKRLNKRWGKYVLINTRFAKGNFSRFYSCSYIEYNKHKNKKRAKGPLSESEISFILEEEKYWKKKFIQYQEMLTILSQKFPELNFILRPHPSEDIKNWKNALKGVKNVHVITEGSVISWIMGALAVIHTGCTTGIESWALQKPVIVYNPDPDYKIEPPLPNKFGHVIGNIDGICKIIEDIVNGKFQNNSSDQLETAYSFIDSIKGNLSAERIIDTFDSLSVYPDNNNGNLEKIVYSKLRNLENISTTLKFKIVKTLIKYQHFIRVITGKRITNYIFGRFAKFPGLLNQFQKFPGLRLKYIKKRLVFFDLIFYNKKPVKYILKKIATDTFLIDKKL
jgi:surface carbohydrate biosynthesis protein